MPLELKQLLLRPPRLTLAMAESLTCGHMQARIRMTGIGAENPAAKKPAGGGRRVAWISSDYWVMRVT